MAHILIAIFCVRFESGFIFLFEVYDKEVRWNSNYKYFKYLFAGENLFIHFLYVICVFDFRFQPQHDKSFKQKHSFYSERNTAFLFIYQSSKNRSMHWNIMCYSLQKWSILTYQTTKQCLWKFDNFLSMGNMYDINQDSLRWTKCTYVHKSYEINNVLCCS